MHLLALLSFWCVQAQAEQSSPRPYRRTFAEVFPKGVELSAETVSLMERKSKQRVALTFDEVTLEDKPSVYHPNDVNVRSFVTRKISLKSCGILSAAMVLGLVWRLFSVQWCS